MAKEPCNNLLFDHIEGFEFFLIFWVSNLSYLPLPQEGTTAEFPAVVIIAPVMQQHGTISKNVSIFMAMLGYSDSRYDQTAHLNKGFIGVLYITRPVPVSYSSAGNNAIREL